MAVLDILQHPHPRLRQPGERVETVDDAIKHIINDLKETMYHYEHCVGLAATQVGIQKAITVIDVSSAKNQFMCLINPVITDYGGREMIQEESCMSVPMGVGDKVGRAEHVTVAYWDEKGEDQTLTADGFLARAVQHEVDHLNGQLFLHRLSRLKRDRLEKRINKAKRYSKQG